MTGPAVPSDEELRAALAEAISNAAQSRVYDAARLADALLPVCRRYADQWAAEELRAAAEHYESHGLTKHAVAMRFAASYLSVLAAEAREATR